MKPDLQMEITEADLENMQAALEEMGETFPEAAKPSETVQKDSAQAVSK